MPGHIIVVGDDALARRIIDELHADGLSVTRLASPADLDGAGVSTAHAVIAAADDDAVNLEVALLARQASATVRVVARLANPVLQKAMNDSIGPGAILDVADLAAPSVVEALLGRTAHTISVAGADLVVATDTCPRDGTVREIYGSPAPVAVIRGDSAPTPGEVLVCPGLDDGIYQGDSATFVGRATELGGRGLQVGDRGEHPGHRSPPVRAFDRARALHEDMNPAFYRVLAAAVLMLIGSTLILRSAYRPDMSWMDALSFATETLSTVGYGVFHFADQPLWLRLWGVLMMLTGIAMISVMAAFLADVLLSRRLPQAASRQRVSHLNHHILIVGLGSFGVRVASLIRDAGHAVVVIESDEENRYLAAADELSIPVITGDATLRATLAVAGAGRASAAAVLTEDDMVNIETGLVLRELTRPAGAESRVPIVLRIYDRALGAAVAGRLDFDHVRSTVELAAPWFIGAAMGLDVLGTFSVGQGSFMVGGVRVQPGSELDGMPIGELSTQTRVIAVERDGGAAELHPGADIEFRTGDTAYLVGPYHELLDTLRKGQPAGRSAATNAQHP